MNEASGSTDQRQLIQDVLDYLQDEWLPNPENQHPNDRDGIERHQAERRPLMDRLYAAIAR